MILKKLIFELINNSTGIKAVELAANPDVILKSKSYDEMHKILDELLAENAIMELEYIVPRIDYRIKSIFFPKGTKIMINQ